MFLVSVGAIGDANGLGLAPVGLCPPCCSLASEHPQIKLVMAQCIECLDILGFRHPGP